jgi:hypothetical protein
MKNLIKILDDQSESTLAMLALWLIGNCCILFAPRLSDDQDAKTHPIQDESSSDKKITKRWNETKKYRNEPRWIERKASGETAGRGKRFGYSTK